MFAHCSSHPISLPSSLHQPSRRVLFCCNRCLFPPYLSWFGLPGSHASTTGTEGLLKSSWLWPDRYHASTVPHLHASLLLRRSFYHVQLDLHSFKVSSHVVSINGTRANPLLPCWSDPSLSRAISDRSKRSSTLLPSSHSIFSSVANPHSVMLWGLELLPDCLVSGLALIARFRPSSWSPDFLYCTVNHDLHPFFLLFVSSSLVKRHDASWMIFYPFYSTNGLHALLLGWLYRTTSCIVTLCSPKLI
ncbi:hypothetical protein B0J11DRAFT_16700 [Dendryphion nanum]|uniref:Uncharacterized protein n=1 Tax=Dendryphion nanum TaxID=256645 RepID=A0A9P9EIW1_9PLEO|nr:hypothetical protein B0J11DRAFT_16700 [Dendryphion nanum]